VAVGLPAQGSSFLATLGFAPESRWDSQSARKSSENEMRSPRHSGFHVRPITLIAAIVVAGLASIARSQEIAPTTAETNIVEELHPPEQNPLVWHIEAKRQFTNRGSVEEASKSTIRLEATPDGFISRVRVDLQFIDEKSGDALTPRLGDTKLRFGFHSLSLGKTSLSPLIETTFPTADPESVGGGKYQLSPGAELYVPLWEFGSDDHPERWKTSFETLIQQVNSVAGDPSRNDINYTRLEPELVAAWGQKLVLSLTPKLVFDWHREGRTGLMLELEGDWHFNRHWRLAVTLGKGLVNTDVPTGYQSKIEFSMRFNF
jgi:hypothetical protein